MTPMADVMRESRESTPLGHASTPRESPMTAQPTHIHWPPVSPSSHPPLVKSTPVNNPRRSRDLDLHCDRVIDSASNRFRNRLDGDIHTGPIGPETGAPGDFADVARRGRGHVGTSSQLGTTPSYAHRMP